MNVKLKRLLLPLLRAVAKGATPTFRMKSAASQALFLLGKPVSLKSKAAKAIRIKKAASSRASHNQETAKIREEVFKRAGGRCEFVTMSKSGQGTAWCQCHNAAEELDHWLHGIGRRRQRQSVETTWALCRPHHMRRTENYPTAASWNEIFAAHCERHEYPFEAHITHEPVPPRTA